MQKVVNVLLDIAAGIILLGLVATFGLAFVVAASILAMDPTEIVIVVLLVAFVTWRTGRFLIK